MVEAWANAGITGTPFALVVDDFLVPQSAGRPNLTPCTGRPLRLPTSPPPTEVPEFPPPWPGHGLATRRVGRDMVQALTRGQLRELSVIGTIWIG